MNYLKLAPLNKIQIIETFCSLTRGSLFFIVYFLLSYQGHSQLLFKLENDSLEVFSYSGGDEFNEPTLNTNLWKDCQWPTINMSQEFVYSRENVKLKDGLVIFEMTKKDSIYRFDPLEIDSNFLREKKIMLEKPEYLFHYAAGSIVSMNKWHYGFYELKFKVEEGKGVWPAFWFFGGNKNEEIDVFELKGERNDEIHVDTHCPSGCGRTYKNRIGLNTSWGGWLPVSNYLHDGFNLMQLEWDVNEVTWYVNGHPLAWFKGNFPNPMSIYINTQVAKDGRAFKPGPDETTSFPNNFYVDYLRVWKKWDATIPVAYKQELISKNDLEMEYSTKPIRKRGLMYPKKKFKNNLIIKMDYLANSKLFVKITGTKSKEEDVLQILNESGKVVLEADKKNQTVDLTPGNYSLILKKGKKSYIKKFKLSL
jgi:hypothetical protein